MVSYKIYSDPKMLVISCSDGRFIPINGENRDCVQFLIDWKAGAEVLNADGSPAPYSDEAVKALGLTPT